MLLVPIFFVAGCALVQERAYNGPNIRNLNGPLITLVRLTDSYQGQRVVRALSEVNSGPVRINRLINNGRFSIESVVRYTSSYLLELSIGIEGNRERQVFFATICGDKSPWCKSSIFKQCAISAGYSIQCNEKGRKIDAPSTVNIIAMARKPIALYIKSCDVDRVLCDEKTIDIIVE